MELPPDLRRRIQRLNQQRERLPAETREIVLLLHAHGGSLRQIGNEVGLSHQQVKRILENAQEAS